MQHRKMLECLHVCVKYLEIILTAKYTDFPFIIHLVLKNLLISMQLSMISASNGLK